MASFSMAWVGYLYPLCRWLFPILPGLFPSSTVYSGRLVVCAGQKSRDGSVPGCSDLLCLEISLLFYSESSNCLCHRTLSSLELPRAVSIASVPSTPVLARESNSHENHESTDTAVSDGNVSIPQYNGRRRQKFHDPARDISIQVLEKFSLVTRFARETTSQLFWETHSNGFGPLERRKSNESPLNYSHEPSDDADKVAVQSPVDPDPLEFEKLSLVWGKPRQPPSGLEDWATFLDSEGRVVDSKALRKRIFYGGVEHKLRKEVWAILLGYYSYESTYAERNDQRSVEKTEYETKMPVAGFISPGQAKRFTKFRERKGLIEKDVVRTDRSLSFYDGDDNANVRLLHDILLTCSFYNFDLGYCQGMNDLLSPILFVMEDESESFWCFVALMERLGPNFDRDQNGMHSQLFAFSKIIGEEMDFDTLLKFINEPSGRIDLDATLRDAEALCICAGENGGACMPPETPPSLPNDNGLLYYQHDEIL
ncbi:RabGAP/TBC domain-containing protein isoform 2 [Hibiscus syriacus]|uniref:RabGAP/TBC domain-containing protein isoform 2 n=1 Tax=Hibiscus syriacus TaxID=106335 RepID=A0A6A2X2S9_HIBSY|nr:RabGAP/TBC domain-containing protein isoform 2 [Hibiscus syriacus]